MTWREIRKMQDKRMRKDLNRSWKVWLIEIAVTGALGLFIGYWLGRSF